MRSVGCRDPRLIFAAVTYLCAAPAHAASGISGRVLGGGAPIASSSVTLWRASPGAPEQVSQAKTGADGRT